MWLTLIVLSELVACKPSSRDYMDAYADVLCGCSAEDTCEEDVSELLDEVADALCETQEDGSTDCLYSLCLTEEALDEKCVKELEDIADDCGNYFDIPSSCRALNALEQCDG